MLILSSQFKEIEKLLRHLFEVVDVWPQFFFQHILLGYWLKNTREMIQIKRKIYSALNALNLCKKYNKEMLILVLFIYPKYKLNQFCPSVILLRAWNKDFIWMIWYLFYTLYEYVPLNTPPNSNLNRIFYLFTRLLNS